MRRVERKDVPASRAYLDHNATTSLRPAARSAILAALDLPGNASSVHAEGRAARNVVERARAQVAGFVGTATANIIFTSGATEALNLVLTPDMKCAGADVHFDVLLAAGGEHACVIEGHGFPHDAVELLPLTASGALDLGALESALARHWGRRVMLALQAANNETGVIQPLREASAAIHAAGGLLVCDAVQAVGRMDAGFAALGVDAMAISAHKFGGPKGIGALCFASGRYHIEKRLLRGGGQERGWRAGTENVAAIAGFAAALEALGATATAEASRLAGWRDEIEAEILRLQPNAIFFGTEAPRLPNTSCFAVPGIEAQVLLMSLDIEGVAVSSGSACSSGKVKRSHVLAAMGIGAELAKGAIRVSLGWDSRAEDLLMFVQAFETSIRTICARQVKPAA
jgi:cysteine desulfurase